jgi:hypothetical protein
MPMSFVPLTNDFQLFDICEVLRAPRLTFQCDEVIDGRDADSCRLNAHFSRMSPEFFKRNRMF